MSSSCVSIFLFVAHLNSQVVILHTILLPYMVCSGRSIIVEASIIVQAVQSSVRSAMNEFTCSRVFNVFDKCSKCLVNHVCANHNVVSAALRALTQLSIRADRKICSEQPLILLLPLSLTLLRVSLEKAV